jgi:2-amino-4-hydroxy-6-hydroxymethyldihydropteridine diphosphokinase
VTLAYVGIGANLGQPREQVKHALEELDRIAETRVIARSSLYRSRPLGYAEQPQFTNAVAALDTGLSAERLLVELQRLESRHGRQRPFRNAPRTLDLDLLLYGDVAMATNALTVPHPRMHERAFVLKPLIEIAPAIAIPGIGAARDCLRACAGQEVERMGSG